jgi:predicted nucleotidyltransferase
LGYPFPEGKYAMISILAQRRAEVEALCRRYHVRRLELFGSAASGQDQPGESDLDFLVEFDPLPPGASAIKNPYLRQSVEHTKALLYAS